MRELVVTHSIAVRSALALLVLAAMALLTPQALAERNIPPEPLSGAPPATHNTRWIEIRAPYGGYEWLGAPGHTLGRGRHSLGLVD